MSAPTREAEVLAIERRRRVRRNQGTFGEKGAGAAHGIEQHAAAFTNGGPACAQQHGGRDILLERRAAALAPIAAPMQALAGKIHRQQCRRPFDVQVQQHVGTFRLDVRALARGIAQIVADRVLEQLGTVDGVPDGFVAAAAITGKRRAGRQVFAPVDAFDGFVHRFRAAGIDRSQAQVHAGCGARPEAGSIPHLERALKFHIMTALANVVRAELREFLGQHRRRAHRCGRDPIAHVVVHVQSVRSRRSIQSSLGCFAK